MYVLYHSYRIVMNNSLRTLIGRVFCHVLICGNVFVCSSQQRGVRVQPYATTRWVGQDASNIDFTLPAHILFAVAFSPIGLFWSSL